jgi:hypothetical protein
MVDPIAPRWPSVRPGRGHYESFYLRAVHPTEPRGIWIRYTVTAPPGGPPVGHLWFTSFDRTAAGPTAVRVDAGEPTTGDGAWIRLGDATFGESEVTGSARSPSHAVSWRLRSVSAEEPLMHLPRDWMYSARLPRTKLLSPRPTAVFRGEFEVDGETVAVDGWPGMVGHNWGEEHAETWIWLSGLAFDGGGPDTWLDVALGRVRLGPVTTPWIANGAVSLAGRRFPLGGPGRRVSVFAADDRCSLRIHGSGVTVNASAAAPADAFVEWDYANPDGGVHRVLNCSVADLSVGVVQRGLEEVLLLGDGRGAYEFGRRVPPLPPTRPD